MQRGDTLGRSWAKFERRNGIHEVSESAKMPGPHQGENFNASYGNVEIGCLGPYWGLVQLSTYLSTHYRIPVSAVLHPVNTKPEW